MRNMKSKCRNPLQTIRRSKVQSPKHKKKRCVEIQNPNVAPEVRHDSLQTKACQAINRIFIMSIPDICRSSCRRYRNHFPNHSPHHFPNPDSHQHHHLHHCLGYFHSPRPPSQTDPQPWLGYAHPWPRLSKHP